MKSRNLKVDAYNPIIYPANGSNLWVRTKYAYFQPLKYRKMQGRPKKRRNLQQGEIDRPDRNMRRTGFTLKCSRCKQTSHNLSTCKITYNTHPTHGIQSVNKLMAINQLNKLMEINQLNQISKLKQFNHLNQVKKGKLG